MAVRAVLSRAGGLQEVRTHRHLAWVNCVGEGTVVDGAAASQEPCTNGYSAGVMNIGTLPPVLFSAAAKAIEEDTVFISFLIQSFPLLLHEGHHTTLAGRA